MFAPRLALLRSAAQQFEKDMISMKRVRLGAGSEVRLWRRAAVAAFALVVCACGGGAGTPPATPPSFVDGLGVSGIGPSAQRLREAPPNGGLGSVRAALANDGTQLIVWSEGLAGYKAIRGGTAGWSAVTPLTQVPASSEIYLASNGAGGAVASFVPAEAMGRTSMLSFSPASGWQPLAGAPGILEEQRAMVMLDDGSIVYARRDLLGTPFVVEKAAGGTFAEQSYPAPSGGVVFPTVIADGRGPRLLAYVSTEAGVRRVSLRRIGPGTSPLDAPQAITDAPGTCGFGFAGQRSPFFSAMSADGNGALALTMSRINGQSGDNTSCFLLGARFAANGNAVVEPLTEANNYVGAAPLVAAGGPLTMVVWNETPAAGSSGRRGWFWSISVQGGSFSAPARFGPPNLPISGGSALAADASGRVLAAAVAQTGDGYSTVYVARFDRGSGWSDWRPLISGAAPQAALAVNLAGQGLLAVSMIPCDREPTAPRQCRNFRPPTLFVVPNP